MGEFFAADFTGSAVEPVLQVILGLLRDFTDIHKHHRRRVGTSKLCGNHPMKVMVVLPDALDFCDATQFTAISECTTGIIGIYCYRRPIFKHRLFSVVWI